MQMRPQLFARTVRIHARRQPHRDLGVRLARQHRLGPRAGIAAPKSVHLDRRPQRDQFPHGVSRIAPCRAADAGIEFRLIERQRRGRRAHRIADRRGVIAEPGNLDAALPVMQAGQQRRHLVQRVAHGTAIAPGMRVLRRGAQRKLQPGQAAPADPQSGNRRAGAAAIGRQHRIGREQIAISLDDGPQTGAAGFLLALDEQLDVHRAATGHRQESGHRLDRNRRRALHVRRTTGVQAAVAHGRLERRRDPKLHRIGRLHVVMAIDDQRRTARRAEPFAEHRRLATTVEQLHVLHAHRAQPLQQEIARGPHRIGIGRIGGNAGHAQQRLQPLENRVALGAEMGNDGI